MSNHHLLICKTPSKSLIIDSQAHKNRLQLILKEKNREKNEKFLKNQILKKLKPHQQNYRIAINHCKKPKNVRYLKAFKSLQNY